MRCPSYDELRDFPHRSTGCVGGGGKRERKRHRGLGGSVGSSSYGSIIERKVSLVAITDYDGMIRNTEHRLVYRRCHVRLPILVIVHSICGHRRMDGGSRQRRESFLSGQKREADVHSQRTPQLRS